MKQTLPKSVVFVTGAFLSNSCWDEWKLYFENKGYSCIAPAWPYKNADPEELRNRHPDTAIAWNNLANLTNHFAAVIGSLPEKPILIGHSLGSLVVQLLLQRGLASAAVAIHSFPPNEISTFRFSFLKAYWEAMGLFTSSRKSYLISFSKWKYLIANKMTCKQQKELYYRYAIPESKKVIRDAFKCMEIDFRKPHAPLLFTSGNNDKIIPVSMNYKNYKKYTDQHSITAYKNFRASNHLVFGHPAWKEEADYILNWLQEIQTSNKKD